MLDWDESRQENGQGELAIYKPTAVQVTKTALGNSLGIYGELASLSRIYHDSD